MFKEMSSDNESQPKQIQKISNSSNNQFNLIDYSTNDNDQNQDSNQPHLGCENQQDESNNQSFNRNYGFLQNSHPQFYQEDPQFSNQNQCSNQSQFSNDIKEPNQNSDQTTQRLGSSNIQRNHCQIQLLETIHKSKNPAKNHPKLFGKYILQYHYEKFPQSQIIKIPKNNEDFNDLISQPNIRESAIEYFESNQIFFDIKKSKVENLSQVIQSFSTYYQAIKNIIPPK